jgi:hypothetical protein
LWNNSLFHIALGCFPFKELYGYEPNLALAPTIEPNTTYSSGDHTNMELHMQALKQHLAESQNNMKLQADKKRIKLEFQVGDNVMLKLQPYVQNLAVNRPYPKLAYKYYDPYEVLQRIGAVAYKLQFPPNNMVHLVFHISQLKTYTLGF